MTGRFHSLPGDWEFEAHTRLQDLHRFTPRMRWQLSSEAANGIVSFRRYVVKRAPVIRNQVSRIESIEQRESITTRQMSFPESRLPPRRMPNGQKSKVKPAASSTNMTLNEMRTLWSQCRIAGKKT